MERLTFQTLEKIGYQGYLLKDAPERVLQFGEGNFLRAFADNFIDLMNEKAGFNGKVVLVQPRGGHPEAADRFQEQNGLYTLILRGRDNGKPVERTRVISCASRCLDPKRDWDKLLLCAHNPDMRIIISNTTEAGIAFDPACKPDETPPSSFPAKLTLFLHERWQQGLPGFLILSCELIDHNGDELKRCVNEYMKLWNLESEFVEWVNGENIFCSTLVDRIVTGSPKADAPRICEQLGYEDKLIDTGEVFAAWVIEGPQSIREVFPFEKADLPIQVVDDVTPYKQRKVRILNGAHTSMILGAYLAGKDIVRDCMQDEAIRAFLNKAMFEEIIPTLDLPEEELKSFAASVIDRFDNPYIDHQLLDIALNSASKWKARVMPSLTEYVSRKGCLPKCLTFSLAAFIAFYHKGERNGEAYPVRDDPWVIEFFEEHKNDDSAALAHAVVNNERLWDGELARIPGLEAAVASCLARIDEAGMYEAMKECLA